MNLMRLSYFVEVCHCKSISLAAKRLFLSQPAVTRAVQALEAEYGVELIIRKNTGIEMTYEGQVLFEQAKELLNKVNKLKYTMHRICSDNKKVRIGVSVIFNEMFPCLMETFQNSYPDVFLETYIFGSSDLRDYLKDDLLDVAILGSQEGLQLCERVILQVESCFWTNYSNPLAKKNYIDLVDDLAGETIVIFREGSMKFQALGHNKWYPLPDDLTANVLLCTNQLDYISRMLRSGTASTFLPRLIFKEYRELVAIPIRQPVLFNISICWNDGYSSLIKLVEYIINYINQINVKDPDLPGR